MSRSFQPVRSTAEAFMTNSRGHRALGQPHSCRVAWPSTQLLYIESPQPQTVRMHCTPTRPLEFETLQLQAGHVLDPTAKARAVPIYASTTFIFNDSAHGADLFGLRMQRFFRAASRLTVLQDVWSHLLSHRKPHRRHFREPHGRTRGWAAAVATASGQSAQSLAISAIANSGDNIVPTQSTVTFKKYSIRVKFVNGDDPKDFEAAINEKTSDIAHDNGIPLIVDNTFGMGGYIIRPISLGADIVVHSGTKWIGGHGTTIAGVVIDSELLRDIGPALNPFGAFLLIQGLETLRLRSQRRCNNTLALATWLAKHPKVAWVSYLGLESHPYHERAKKLLCPGAYGGVLSFGVKGDHNVASKAVDALRLASNLANMGDAKTLVIHPATTTHEQLTEDERLTAGVTPDLIRVAVRIEHTNDIIADFEQADTATVYISFSSLKSYVEVNYSGFRKILKKYDKVTYDEASRSKSGIPSFRASRTSSRPQSIASCAKCITGDDPSQQLKVHRREHIAWERDTVWRQMLAQERREAAGASDTIVGGILVRQEESGIVNIPTPLGGFRFKQKRVPLMVAIAVVIALMNMDVVKDGPEANKYFPILIFSTIMWASEAIPFFVTSTLVPFLLVVFRVIRLDGEDPVPLPTPDATK
ncbi:pyridoxal phosphate-dependent transferase [Butyriboletus roseoflavus]|nr:pyridoxal phosphate-dependent transferase [Butyriboletus roseoflavus]